MAHLLRQKWYRFCPEECMLRPVALPSTMATVRRPDLWPPPPLPVGKDATHGPCSLRYADPGPDRCGILAPPAGNGYDGEYPRDPRGRPRSDGWWGEPLR